MRLWFGLITRLLWCKTHKCCFPKWSFHRLFFEVRQSSPFLSSHHILSWIKLTSTLVWFFVSILPPDNRSQTNHDSHSIISTLICCHVAHFVRLGRTKPRDCNQFGGTTRWGTIHFNLLKETTICQCHGRSKCLPSAFFRIYARLETVSGFLWRIAGPRNQSL